MTDKVPVQQCKKRLLVTWLAGSALLAFMLMLLSMQEEGPYADKVGDAWSWFLPNVIPTLSLMIGVAVKEFTSSEERPKTIDRFLYRLGVGLSVAYFTVMFSSITLQPWFSPNTEPVAFLTQSNLWLGPMQGLVTLALGVFFGKAEKGE